MPVKKMYLYYTRNHPTDLTEIKWLINGEVYIYTLVCLAPVRSKVRQTWIGILAPLHI